MQMCFVLRPVGGRRRVVVDDGSENPPTSVGSFHTFMHHLTVYGQEQVSPLAIRVNPVNVGRKSDLVTSRLRLVL